MPQNDQVSAAIYVRISQDRAGAGLGVDRQEQDCRALGASLGWDVVHLFADNDVSAYSGKRRPQYEALLESIESGSVTGVLTWHPDRLHRSVLELENYVQLSRRHGVNTHSVQAGHWDLSTPSGRAVAVTLSAWAQYESEHKGQRISRARQQQAADGRFHGGIRPFGFERDGMTLRDTEAKELAHAAQQIVSGVPLRSIVRDLNARGIPTATGRGMWTAVALRDILCNARTAGLSVYKGEVVGKAKWPAIVSEETWQAARTILTDPARRTNNGRGPGVRWLGSGLYVCGVCGEAELRASTSGQKRCAYRCRSRDRAITGGHVSREATALDKFVQDVMVERLSRPGLVNDAVTADDSTDVAALRQEAEVLRVRQDQLAEAFADGAVSRSQLAAGSKRMEERSAQIAAQLAAAGGKSPLDALAHVKVTDMAAEWSKLNLGQRRTIIDYLATVTVLPVGNSRGRFDPAGVRIDWKR